MLVGLLGAGWGRLWPALFSALGRSPCLCGLRTRVRSYSSWSAEAAERCVSLWSWGRTVRAGDPAASRGCRPCSRCKEEMCPADELVRTGFGAAEVSAAKSGYRDSGRRGEVADLYARRLHVRGQGTERPVVMPTKRASARRTSIRGSAPLRRSVPVRTDFAACRDRRGSVLFRDGIPAARTGRLRGRRPGGRRRGSPAQGRRASAGCRGRRRGDAPDQADEGLRAARRIGAEHPGTAVSCSPSTSRRPTPSTCCRKRPSAGRPVKDRVADVESSRRRSTSRPRRLGAHPRSSRCCSAAAAAGPARRADPREREVLGLMAEGRSNAAMADALVVSERAVEKHVTAILSKLDLPPAVEDHRRCSPSWRSCERV